MVAGNIPTKLKLFLAIYSAVENGEDEKGLILVLIVLWICNDYVFI